MEVGEIRVNKERTKKVKGKFGSVFLLKLFSQYSAHGVYQRGFKINKFGYGGLPEAPKTGYSE